MPKHTLEDILKNCHYIPSSTIHNVIDIMETRQDTDPLQSYCKRNLAKVQQSRMNHIGTRMPCDQKFKNVFLKACCRAIYSHDWNKLLYLLRKCPPWEHNWKDINESAHYIRALIILLMYHPSSQSQGLLNNYLHLVWSCRTDSDKKAVQKILLTLPDKLCGVIYGKYAQKKK